jgi:hypothetical protein
VSNIQCLIYSVSEKIFFSFSGFIQLLSEDAGKYKQLFRCHSINIKLIEAYKFKCKIVPVHAVRYIEGREVEQHSFLILALGVCDWPVTVKFKSKWKLHCEIKL